MMCDASIGFENVEVSDMHFEDEGTTLVLWLVDGQPPHHAKCLKLIDVLAISIWRMPGEEFPYYIDELHCHRLAAHEVTPLMNKLGWVSGATPEALLGHESPIVHVETLGALTAHFIARDAHYDPSKDQLLE